MAKCTFYRTRTINLKPILEELESELEFMLIFNSSSGGIEDVIREDWQDFDVTRGKIKILWDLGFIEESEYASIRRYFYKMTENTIEEAKKLKAK